MSRRKILTIAGIPVWWDGTWIEYTAGMTIDGDGAPQCYHPTGSPPGLDYTGNAGKPGNWWALATDNKEPDGEPIIQDEDDPAPGFYVSMTAYTNKGVAYEDPLRYLDSAVIPFAVIPPKLRNAVPPKFLGCHVEMTNLENEKFVSGIMGDIGPDNKLGEASIAAAAALGIKSSPKNGGTSRKIVRYRLRPGVPATIDGRTYPLI